jgi:hypothetical protein
MPRAKRSTKLRASKTERIAGRFMPDIQARRGNLVLVAVSNHSDEDQRHMVRSGERVTVRRKCKIEELYDRKVIDQREMAALKWYADAHELRYGTSGITANYGGVGGGGRVNYDHLAKNVQQAQAALNFEYARAGIQPQFRGLLDRVVLLGRPLGKLGSTFREAVRQLMVQIEGKVAL